jgi:hypothetical protein
MMFTPRDIYSVRSLAILDIDLHIGIPEQPFHNGCLPTTERCDLDCRRCCGPPDGLVGWCRLPAGARSVRPETVRISSGRFAS